MRAKRTLAKDVVLRAPSTDSQDCATATSPTRDVPRSRDRDQADARGPARAAVAVEISRPAPSQRSTSLARPRDNRPRTSMRPQSPHNLSRSNSARRMRRSCQGCSTPRIPHPGSPRPLGSAPRPRLRPKRRRRTRPQDPRRPPSPAWRLLSPSPTRRSTTRNPSCSRSFRRPRIRPYRRQGHPPSGV